MQIWKDNQLHLEEIKLEMGVARYRNQTLYFAPYLEGFYYHNYQHY
jgi:hypothetical protein